MKSKTRHIIRINWRLLSLIGLIILVSGCHKSFYLTYADYHRYDIKQDTLHTSVGAEISQLIGPYKSQLDDEMSVVIGRVPVTLQKGRIESTLGNWVADAIAEYVNKQTGRKVDLAICNYGGLRIPQISAGPLTVGKIYELMPFDNYVVTMELNGQVLTRLLEKIADYGGWPVSSSLRMEVSNDRITKAEINGQSISAQKIYLVALSDYLANGGDRLDLLTSLPYHNLNVYYRDALIQSAKNQEVIVAEIEGRIKYSDQ